jgi:hypothetical protein
LLLKSHYSRGRERVNASPRHFGAGRTSNGYTLYSGLYLGEVAIAPPGTTVFLPLIEKDFCGGFTGPEQEDNDAPAQANGPLCSGQVVTGSIYDSNESAANENSEDWFYFLWSGDGQVTIEVTSFPAMAGVFLYRDPPASPLDWVANQPGGKYTIVYDGTSITGKYYVRLFVDGTLRPGIAPDYALKVTLSSP